MPDPFELFDEWVKENRETVEKYDDKALVMLAFAAGFELGLSMQNDFMNGGSKKTPVGFLRNND